MEIVELHSEASLLSQLDDIANALAETGYVLISDALNAELAASLMAQAHTLAPEVFNDAGTGRESLHQLNQRVRTDRIVWLSGATENVRAYLELMELLRAGLNERLFLGLFDYECHFSSYAPGAYYRKHLDAFAGRRNRILSTVYYLNPAWTAQAGGELVLYAPDESRLLQVVNPVFNTMVLFLSERFPHEVLTTHEHRYSLTGWFRVNTSTEQVPDPAT